MNRKIIITGYEFSGYKLAKKLLGKSLVIGIDNFFSGDKKEKSKNFEIKKLNFFRENIQRSNSLIFPKNNNDIYGIIHLAGVTDVNFSKNNENLTMKLVMFLHKKEFMK